MSRRSGTRLFDSFSGTARTVTLVYLEFRACRFRQYPSLVLDLIVAIWWNFNCVGYVNQTVTLGYKFRDIWVHRRFLEVTVCRLDSDRGLRV